MMLRARHLSRRAAVGLWLSALCAAGCAREQQQSALERVRTAGLRAGFAIEPPYAFIDSITGEPTGEAPEILHRLASALNIDEVRWYPFQFQNLTEALVQGRIDVIAAGMFASPERSRDVRFSSPTACVRPLLVGRAGARGETARLPDPAESARSCDACRVAVIEGSVEQGALERHGTPRESLIIVPDLSTGVAAVVDDAADVIAISAPTARDLVRRNATLTLDERRLPDAVASEAGGCPAFGFRHRDEVLAEAFDSVLQDFLGSPAHLEAVTSFGFTEAEVSCARDAAADRTTMTAACVSRE